MACAAGWHLAQGSGGGRACEAHRAAGAACGDDGECAGGACVGGRCCRGAARDYCAACDEAGGCGACASGRVLHAGDCHEVRGDGAACTAVVVCASGRCLGGACCDAAVDTACAACASGGGGGRCVGCNHGYVLVGAACVDAVVHAEATRAAAAAAAAARAETIRAATANAAAAGALTVLFGAHVLVLWVLAYVPRMAFDALSSLSARQVRACARCAPPPPPLPPLSYTP